MTEFCNRFLGEEDDIQVADLEGIKQRPKEGLIPFIERYKAKALRGGSEHDLVGECIRNVQSKYQALLSLGGVSTFAKLRKRAVDISKVEKRDKKRPREPDAAFNVHTRNKPKGCTHKATPTPKDHEARSDLLPIPLLKSQVIKMIAGWFNYRTLKG